MVNTNNLPSTKGKGQVTSGFWARPMNRLNHVDVRDSFESTTSLRIHFSHLGNPSTVKDSTFNTTKMENQTTNLNKNMSR